MLRKPILSTISMVVILVMAFAVAPGVHGQTGLPSYQLQYLGNGSPSAINNSGVVVGSRLNGNNHEPLVSINGAPWSALPAPSGAMSTFPTDVNDSGVIVGVSFDTAWNPVAVRWNPGSGGYTVEVLPRIAGDASAYATGINNLGQIIGARRALGYTPTGSGWLYQDGQPVVDLAATYGLWTAPNAINDLGQIISGVERLTLSTGVREDLGAGPSNYNAVGAVAINNNSMMVGTASLRSTSLNIISVFRYEGAAGWRFIAGTSRYTVANSINLHGDIGYGEQGAGLYLDGLGTYAVGSLLDPAVTAAGWAISGNGALINDQRAVATLGRNSITGQSGGVLLTQSGTLAPPSAPANLQGVAHTATRMEPFNSINLTWENTSSLTTGYELERRELGGSSWTRLALTPPGTATNHTDTTVGVGVTYDYRVRATGLGGASPWSNVITVTAPATPLDTQPPVVSVVTPANGATVSGVVTVTAQASDNVAVEYLEISYWNQYLGQQVILGSVSNAGALTASWDTRNLTPATYVLRAYAYDSLGNWSQAEVSVNVSATGSNTLRVSNIALSASGSKTLTVNGRVTVRNSSGASVSGASVSINWRLPNGSTVSQNATTNSSGVATFTIRSSRGTYTLNVTNVTKTGYTLDTANSVLTKSITR